jgi:2-dehydro-3-deoxygluconokinase
MSGRIVAVGECMVELSPEGKGLYRRGFAGDTFNTAWYLRRRLPADWRVGYATGVGTDALSDRMVAFMAEAGIETGAVRRVPDRTVGLYMIELCDGERSFSYWRSMAAARMLAADRRWLEGALHGADVVFLSGITLAVVQPEDRETFFEVLKGLRAEGTMIVFDPNLRPRLWPDAATMRAAMTAGGAAADIVLPSFEDESVHFGDAGPEATLARYRDLGAATVVVKNGPGEVLAWDSREGRCSFVPEPVKAVDTTAAGDSFNAGFLAARLTGVPLREAIAAGAALAAAVVQAPGALVEV